MPAHFNKPAEARGRASIFGRPLDGLTMEQAARIICQAWLGKKFFHVVTANAEMLYHSRRDKELAKIIDAAEMVTADGAGVVLASLLLACRVPERVAGYDLMLKCLEKAALGHVPVYFLGSQPDILKQAVSNALHSFPGLQVAGSHHGYFQKKEEQAILDEINFAGPGLLLVAMGVPKQEKWIYYHRERLPACVAMGVGGSLDVLAGKTRRAPPWMQRAGLEWFYRILKEPSRLKRASVLPLFMCSVFWEAFIKNSKFRQV